ncbi:spliceosome-associated protein CWC27 homolog isoform X2 [Plodia interpunctella]|uniref:spliceosome-associated protein CWC27 homolog isoform X2 n=1 Tax=Plodia interpunctella TaxID=58824 RepID=UPI002368D302|nr:spliceosome-associated protein CWC27 homolog isoform X2 [Plodia interpunctella]
MSNIYIQEPPALGKVLLKTSAGDIDIELWTKEAPKACRNFIQLCMENYYNGTIFHRVVPGFIVQGGDPNGDGTGGESIYGSPFKDEFHSRLRFNRRGLVAMANAGKDDNGSQFFFTLAATPELQNKHTIFGKVTGETIYNVLKLTEGLIGPDDRPEHPHKIINSNIVINPFEDIVPRVVEKPAEAPKKKKKERKAVKNFGLLSFGEEAEEDEGEALEYKGKPKSTHDLLEDPKLSKKTAAELEQEEQEERDKEETTEEAEERKQKTQAAVTSIRDKLSKGEERSKREASPEEGSRKRQKDEDSDSEGEYYLGKERDMERKKERERIRNEIKQLKKEMKAPKEEPVKETETDRQSNKMEEDNEMYKQYVEEQERYKKMKEKVPKKGTARENFTLELLAKFKNKLHAIKEKAQTEGETETKDEEEDINTDNWLGHTLKFEDKGAVLAKDASTKGDDWFDIYDPRNPINKRKREKKGERKNKK